MHPIILIHGGAWDIPDELVIPHETGVETAVRSAIPYLGISAVDAVVEAVSSMEDDPTFDAGTGSFLNKVGSVELDAVIIEGTSMNTGAIAAVKRIKNPIRAARVVMEYSDTLFLCGKGAEKFVSEHEIPLCSNEELIIKREKNRWKKLSKKGKATEDFFNHGTVGAVALDSAGQIVAGTSTGGTPFKQPGRIGDSPLLGAGTYATQMCAVSCTGWGEAIMKAGTARTVADFIEKGECAQNAAEKAIQILKKRFSGYGGAIVVTTQGDYGIAYNTPRMASAVYSPYMDVPLVNV